MKVYVTNGSNVNKFILPSSGDDFFTYSYKIKGLSTTFLLTFERQNNIWYFKSNGIVNIADNPSAAVEINNYSQHKLRLLGYNSLIYLSVLPQNEQVYELDLRNTNQISIGSTKGNTIIYYNQVVSPNHATITKNERGFLLNVIDKQYGVYVNNNRVEKCYLKAGDIVFINGLKIIWMQKYMSINNPNDKVKVSQMSLFSKELGGTNLEFKKVSDEEQAIEMFTEDDYFYHKPKLKEVIEESIVRIDPPPGKAVEEELPWYILLVSSVSMMGISFMMTWNLFEKIQQGKKLITLTPQIVMVITMLFGSFCAPRILASYKKKANAKKERQRIAKYTDYLNQKDKEIMLNVKAKTQIYNDNYVPIALCKQIALSRENRYFWSRELGDEDFLRIRLGLGNIDSPLKVDFPERHFTMEIDDLLENAYQIQEKYKKLNNVPITVSLTEKNITSFVCDSNYLDMHEYFNNMLVQLVALHSPNDLKIVILTNKENRHKWELTKFLPHCFNDDRSIRLFASNEQEAKQISDFLEGEFNSRKLIIDGREKKEDGEKVDTQKGYLNFDCYYLIISDCYKNNIKLGILDNLFKCESNLGFSFVSLTDSIKNTPTKCNTYVEIGQKDGCVLDKNISSKNQQSFSIEYDNDLDMEVVCKNLLNIPIVTKEGLNVLPNSLSFLDMYGVSRVEQLNISNRWKSNDPVTNLSAPIGVYASGEQFMLNLHEKNHGPHGLIAGSTGSGKSEFIITYILSMCVNYHPYEVQFVLIDYKGGGLAGAFENRETGVRVPHLVGTITNLDVAEMNRTLVSIESELKRRQRVFNEVRDSLGESTIDIYKYQRLYREGAVKVPMSHLFIISDEFAELKAQQPEFMAQLISTARIGRSLGVHLILATQKPSGVVNDQIWSNSKFKVCLKVQDRSDSMEMLKKPDAASIKEAGRFYLQVGYDDFFDKGQSGWAGAKYVPSDKIIKKVDDSLSFIDDSGTIIKSVKEITKVETNDVDYGDQITNIVKYINDLGAKENIKTKRLWLDSIPGEIFVNNLKTKYGYATEPFMINPVIGEYDIPSAQSQKLLTINLSNSGNTLIMGKQGSGKENLVSTIILSIVADHRPEEVNFYIIDCGTEALKIFDLLPHVGDVACTDDIDKGLGIIDLCYNELEKRKEIMAEYGGSYNEYNNNNEKKLPLIVTIINNFEIFTETYGRQSESVYQLFRDGARYGLIFIVTELSPITVKPRQMQNFTYKLCLQLANEGDYRNYLDSPRGLIPAKYFGRGLCFIEEGTFEFQTAYFTLKSEINKYVRESAKVFNEAYKIKAPAIPTIPDKVLVSELLENVTDLSNVPIGYRTDTKQIYNFDFRMNTFTTIITSSMNDIRMSFLYSLMKLFSHIPNTKVKVIDFVEAYEKEIENISVIKDNFEENLLNLNNEILGNKDEANNYIYFFLGIGAYKNVLDAGSKELINNIFTNVNKKENVKIILMDVLVSYKNIQVESWYQSNIDNSTGIWLAEDPANQLVINCPNLTMEDRKLNFPCISFAITKGNHIAIKHVIDEGEEK